jgi:UDP-N-acetylmuramate dehydrogenase
MTLLETIEGVQKNVNLSEFTTFKLGGPADYYYELTDVMMIPILVEACKKDKVPYLLLAWGSNLVFSDKGYRGLVIRNMARNIKLAENMEASGVEGEDNFRPAGQLIMTDSGALLSEIIQFSHKNGLTGMEKMMGIPGTIGGAVRGNAGAFGRETKHLFDSALIYDPEASAIKEVDWDYMEFSYRHSRVKRTSEILLKVALRLAPGDMEAAIQEVKEIFEYRQGRHPHGHSAGSFFKNPSRNSVGKGASAGQLIEDCGFKDSKIGGAYISVQHCNFLMNDGSATMDDVLELSTQIQKAVLEKCSIKLQREVALVGEHGFLEDEYAS